MSIFNYTLPSGANFTMSAPAGTTQAEADKIFYSQVAAGTFVGYNPGDTLTTPTETINNFGISRLQRGTAGVDEKALLSIISGLPIVAPLPATLNSIPVSNAITQANYVQVNSDPINGVYSLGPSTIGTGPNAVKNQPGAGQLNPQQMQAIMAQVAAIVNQDASVMTQSAGIGKYGFSTQQLENAGYIKPGFSQMYSAVNPSAQSNPDNFTCMMSSPAPWTGLGGVYSVNDILKNPSLQNKIQEKLMNQGYSSMVSTGVIVPPTPTVTTPRISTGKIYTANGTLSEVGPLTLLNNSSGSVALNTPELTTPVGTTPATVNNLGTNAVAQYNAGLNSLSSGAVGFSGKSTSGLSQRTGLASNQAGGTLSSISASISSTLNGDIGALVANSSKYGVSLTLGWAQSAGSLSNINAGSFGALNVSNDAYNNINNLNRTGINLGGLSGINPQAIGSINISNALAGPALSKLNLLAKSAQFGVNFSDFALSGLVSGVRSSPGFSNTVNRSTIDASVVRVIGSPLIAPPVYGLPSSKNLGVAADINAAQNILSTVSAVKSVQNALSQGTAALSVNINKFR
jgi:hypothetical protein